MTFVKIYNNLSGLKGKYNIDYNGYQKIYKMFKPFLNRYNPCFIFDDIKAKIKMKE